MGGGALVSVTAIYPQRSYSDIIGSKMCKINTVGEKNKAKQTTKIQ